LLDSQAFISIYLL